MIFILIQENLTYSSNAIALNSVNQPIKTGEYCNIRNGYMPCMTQIYLYANLAIFCVICPSYSICGWLKTECLHPLIGLVISLSGHSTYDMTCLEIDLYIWTIVAWWCAPWLPCCVVQSCIIGRSVDVVFRWGCQPAVKNHHIVL